LAPVNAVSSRRGTYRIDETTHSVHVLDIDHRAEIYRPHS
jgi:mRNA-degrading endonuclease RelE of RelBE toxin-antitoxin system